MRERGRFGLRDPRGQGLDNAGQAYDYHKQAEPCPAHVAEVQSVPCRGRAEAIASLRAAKGETNADARELFVRCAKLLLLGGPVAQSQTDRLLGLPLELVAERNPYLLKAGGILPVRILYKNQPPAGVLVMALNQRHPTARVAARSDKPGGCSCGVSTGTMADQGRAHDPGDGGRGSPVGQFLGVADLRGAGGAGRPAPSTVQ